MEEILKKVGDVISWYQENYNTENIHLLLRSKDNLVTLNYNLAEEVAEHKKLYNIHYFIRKIAINKTKNSYINQKKSAVESQNIAEIEQADKLEAELEAEAISFRLDLLLKQSNKIVDAMQQRISFMRYELENTRKTNNT